MAKKSKPAITTDVLTDMLQRHICKDGQNGHGFAFITNVRNGTGFQRREGYADAISMDLMPSRGLLMSGFELKVSRNDWLKELKKPDKADWFFRHCDRWFLVVGDKDIVHEGELPETWGLIAPRGTGLAVIKAAPVNENKEPVDQLFLASLLRSAVRASAKPKELREEYEKGYEAGKQLQKQQVEHYKTENAMLQDRITKFQQASGVSMDRWHAGGKPEEIGAALKLVLSGEKDANRILGRLARIGGDIEALLDEHGIDKENPPSEF